MTITAKDDEVRSGKNSGNRYKNKRGNKTLQELIRATHDRYKDAQNEQSEETTRDILLEIYNVTTTGVHRGRFLYCSEVEESGTEVWIEMTQEEAFRHISTTFSSMMQSKARKQAKSANTVQANKHKAAAPVQDSSRNKADELKATPVDDNIEETGAGVSSSSSAAAAEYDWRKEANYWRSEAEYYRKQADEAGISGSYSLLSSKTKLEDHERAATMVCYPVCPDLMEDSTQERSHFCGDNTIVPGTVAANTSGEDAKIPSNLDEFLHMGHDEANSEANDSQDDAMDTVVTDVSVKSMESLSSNEVSRLLDDL